MTWEEYYEKYAKKIYNDMITRPNLPHAQKMLKDIEDETYREFLARGPSDLNIINEVIKEQDEKLNAFGEKFTKDTGFKSPFKHNGVSDLFL